jgi:hypothetical protein
MRENPIFSKFQEEDLKKVRENIKSGKKKLVYTFFKCRSEGNYPRISDCGDCPYLYKKDIRVLNKFGCYVNDYIDMVEGRPRIRLEPI